MSFFRARNAQRVFLDYAATTPVSTGVFRVMKPFFTKHFANPSSIHKEGVYAREVVERARKDVASVLSVKKEDIFFTAGGTESINLALLGVARFYLRDSNFVGTPHILVTAVEHPAVLETARQLEREGVSVTLVPVREDGLLEVQTVVDALRPETVLVSCMYANNEIGTILPIGKISKRIAAFKKEQGRGGDMFPFVHTDASQAANYLSVQIDGLHVDMMTLDSSKIYGPKGVGVLYKKKHVPITPVLFGGSQEGGLRAGTEVVTGVVGCAAALDEAQALRRTETERLQKLQTYFITKLQKQFPNCSINGSTEYRLPNNVNVCFPGTQAEFLVLQLDAKGIACSAVTACKSNDESGASYVITALGQTDCAASSIRFSMGRATTKKDIDVTLAALNRLL